MENKPLSEQQQEILLTQRDAQQAEAFRQEIIRLQTLFALQTQKTVMSMQGTRDLANAARDVFEQFNTELEAWRTESTNRSAMQQDGVNKMAEQLQQTVIAALTANVQVAIKNYGAIVESQPTILEPPAPVVAVTPPPKKPALFAWMQQPAKSTYRYKPDIDWSQVGCVAILVCILIMLLAVGAL